MIWHMATESNTPKRERPLHVHAELIPLEEVRVQLAKLWLLGSLTTGSILVLQSLLGKYGQNVQEVWGWVLPSVMPTLGMVLAVLGYTALDRTLLQSVVRRTFYDIAWWLSLVYLALLALTVLIQP